MVDSRENGSGSPRSERPDVRVHVFGRTDVGMVREHNEDNFLVADLSQKNRSLQPEVQKHAIGDYGSVFAVCDGMGGAAAGEVASQIGVDTIYEMLQLDAPPDSDEGLARRMDEAVCEAGRRIHAESKANSARRGMGTTATVAVLRSDRLIFGQVGDSRAHIIRNGVLVQTTKDQSLVQQLLDANQLTPEEAKNFDRSNIILQALGTAEEVHVDLTSVILRKGDILVICSDGLSGMVEPEDIRDVVLSIESPSEACQKLTRMACDNGGDDNVTVIVAKFDGDGLLPPGADDAVTYEKYIVATDDDTDDSTTSIRGTTGAAATAAGTFDAGAKRSTAQKLPMLVLITALAMIGLVIGFSLSKKSNSDSALPDDVPPSVVVSPDSDTVPEGSVEDTDEDSSSGISERGEGQNTAAHGGANDNDHADIAGGANASSNDMDEEMEDADSDEDIDQSEPGETDKSIKRDTDADTATPDRSDDNGDASAEEDIADGGAAEGKWSRVKSDRKRVSEDEKEDTDEADSAKSSAIEENPY